MDSALSGLDRHVARRAVLAATIGNGLEFYDFVTFAFFAIQIGHTFFPSADPFVSLMGSLATFGAGFLSRPIGAYILGGYADRHGRKPAMLFSMTLMGCAIAVMALTPGYAQIGVAAPIIVVLARLAQGFALGGEVGSATTYMMEAAAPEKRGYTISWQGASQTIAASTGAGVGLILSLVMNDAELTSYGWRIALLLGTAIVPVAIIIRRSLPETRHIEEAPELATFSEQRVMRSALLGVVIIGGGTIATYIFNYMATYGQHSLGLSTSVSMAGEFANNAAAIPSYLVGGWLSDRIGRRTVMLVPTVAFLFAIVPCFMWLNAAPGAFTFIASNVILGVLSSFGWGAVYASISESLPRAVRARGFALIYSLPVTVLGGTTQLMITWLIKATGDPMSVAWYLTGVTVICISAMLMVRESAPVRLRALAQSA